MLLFVIELLNSLYKKIISLSYEIYSRLFLRNNVDEKIIKIIKDAQKKFNKENLIIDEVNDVKFYKKNENVKSFIIEVFLINNDQKKFNIQENLYIIKGVSIGDINNIIELKLKNSDDLGEIIPENTNKYFF